MICNVKNTPQPKCISCQNYGTNLCPMFQADRILWAYQPQTTKPIQDDFFLFDYVDEIKQ